MALSKPLTYSLNRSSRSLRPEIPAKKLWPGYRLTQDEQGRIDAMMGRALLDNKFCERLVTKRDSSALAEYELSFETQTWLCSIEASSLTEFAQAIAFS